VPIDEGAPKGLLPRRLPKLERNQSLPDLKPKRQQVLVIAKDPKGLQSSNQTMEQFEEVSVYEEVTDNEEEEEVAGTSGKYDDNYEIIAGKVGEFADMEQFDMPPSPKEEEKQPVE